MSIAADAAIHLNPSVRVALIDYDDPYLDQTLDALE